MGRVVIQTTPGSIEEAHQTFCEFVERTGLTRSNVAKACLWYADQAERFNMDATAASYRDSARKTKAGLLPMPNEHSCPAAIPKPVKLRSSE